MQQQYKNVETKHITADESLDRAKEKCEIRSLKEVPTSLMNISTKFVTDNQKAMLKKSKTSAEVLQSSQAQEKSSSEHSSMISVSSPALCTNISSPENSSTYKCNTLTLKSTQDKEILDISEELQNHEPSISDLRTSSTTNDD